MAGIERLNSLRQAAALLHERARQKNASAESRAALRTWLDESPEHAGAHQAIVRTWLALASVAEDPSILELRQQAARRLTPASANRRSLRWATAAVVMVFLGTALWIVAPRAGFDFSPLAWLKSGARDPVSQSFATKTGDRLTAALSDGSHVTLNTATRLEVTFSQKARTVRLLDGEALFEVAKDASRPFVVQTQSRRFIAVGTAFDVRLDREQIKVTMLEGTVRAESSGPGIPVRTTVIAGEQLIARGHSEDHVQRIDPERETSWRHGRVIFDNTLLSEAIDELNRYSETQIKLADPKLANLRLSGTFATGRTSAFVEAIAAYFPIQIGHADEHTVTLRARP